MSEPAAPLLTCENLRIDVGNRVLVDALDVSVRRGELLGVLGQNGSGKTLTMHTLAGLRAPGAGFVQLDGDDLTSISRQAVARRLALLPQHVDDIFPATVLDTAMIGRHPHIGRFQWESPENTSA